MEELLKIDPTFNEGMFITKVNNIFVMLLSSFMMDNLSRVRHFISDEVNEKYEKNLKKLNKQNLRQMYDELNVKTTTIKDVEIKDDCVIIKVDIVSRAIEYLVNKDTGDYVTGIKDYRIEKTNHLEFTKKFGAKGYGMDKKCPGCGANIDVNKNGKCEYCGTIFNAENYDWILTSIEV